MDTLFAISDKIGPTGIFFVVISLLWLLIAVCFVKKECIVVCILAGVGGTACICGIGWALSFLAAPFIEYLYSPPKNEKEVMVAKGKNAVETVLSSREHSKIVVTPGHLADATECPRLYDIPYHFKSVLGEKGSYGIVCYNTFWHEVRVVKEK